jgi:alkanesulfonate monooxygenase SsuD/methylene tetrahydromethanopterin reductase-like flavin-dependent oxidoreductase (luciferase family)
MEFGFIPTEGGHMYQESLRQVETGERLGFDSVWMEEHHGIQNHYWPSPLMVLAGYATRTQRLKLGTDIAVLPFYNPVRAAEDSAMLDVMSCVRMIFGVAIGYRPDEFVMMGTPLEQRGSRTAEAIELIRQLWTQEEVSFQGKHYNLDKVRIEPKPFNPALPLWIGGWGELSLKRAAEIGDAWLPGPTADLAKLLDCQMTYHRFLKDAGLAAGKQAVPLTRETVIADTDEEAWEMAEKHLLINYRDEYAGGWLHPLVSQEQAPGNLRALDRERFIIGSPDTCAAKIRHYSESFGVTHLIFRLFFPGTPEEFILHELELLGREVLPAFR